MIRPATWQRPPRPRSRVRRWAARSPAHRRGREFVPRISLDTSYADIERARGSLDDAAAGSVRTRLSDLRHELLAPGARSPRRGGCATRARRTHRRRRSRALPPDVERLFSDTYDTLVRATGRAGHRPRALLAGVRDHHQSKVVEGQSEVAKKLTVIASLVLVPSLIVGFYGQNFEAAFDDAYWSMGVSTGLIVVVDDSSSSRSSAGAAGSEADSRGRWSSSTQSSQRGGARRRRAGRARSAGAGSAPSPRAARRAAGHARSSPGPRSASGRVAAKAAVRACRRRFPARARARRRRRSRSCARHRAAGTSSSSVAAPRRRTPR